MASNSVSVRRSPDQARSTLCRQWLRFEWYSYILLCYLQVSATNCGAPPSVVAVFVQACAKRDRAIPPD
eukprot:2988867-Amphidinium_carterae.1